MRNILTKVETIWFLSAVTVHNNKTKNIFPLLRFQPMAVQFGNVLVSVERYVQSTVIMSYCSRWKTNDLDLNMPWLVYCRTSKRILERLGIQNSSSFVKIWEVCIPNSKAFFYCFYGLFILSRNYWESIRSRSDG